MLRPTAMFYRNLASMDVEESIRGNPVDGVVLLMGCDKTTPSLMMGAASVDLPTIGVSAAGRCSTASGAAGARLGHRRVEHERAGARRHARSPTFRSRKLHAPQPRPLHDHGHGQHDGQHGRGARRRPAGNAAYPAVDGRRNVLAARGRRRIVDRWCTRTRSCRASLTREAFENASARWQRDRRLDQRGDPPDRDRRAPGRAADHRRLRPPGQRDALPREPAASGKFLMEDFCCRRRFAGGDEGDRQPSAPGRRRHRQRQNARRREHRRRAELQPRSSHRWPRRSRPAPASPCCAATSAPRGAVISFRRPRRPDEAQRGRAVVFETSRISTPASTTSARHHDETCILVLKNCGPARATLAWPRWATMPLPPAG